MNTKHIISISFLFLSGLLTSILAATSPPRQLFLQDENSIWLGTQLGLCRYQSENELWTTVKSDPVLDMCLDEDIVWLGTTNGLHYADRRYLDWKRYTAEQGLPSDSIIRVVADLDYIYAAGPHGLARMDKLVEQWETIGDFSTKQIYDCYIDQDYLWVATDQGIHYFEKQYEKWKTYTAESGLLSNTALKIFFFNDYIWILTDKGLSRYSTSMKSWNSYSFNSDIPGSAAEYVWLDADYIWLATPEGVIRYSGKNQTWEIFSKNTQIENLSIQALSTTGKISWFATSDGVYSFDEDKRRWTLYTALEGLSDDVQEALYCIGQTVVCQRGNSFGVYFPAEDLFHTKEVAAAKGAGDKKGNWDFYNDERGLGVGLPGGQSVSLLGRAYFKLKNKADFPAPVGTSIKEYVLSDDLDSIVYDTFSVYDSLIQDFKDTVTATDTIARFNDFLYWWPKANLNLNVDLKNGRTLRGSFDNTDPLGALHWGVEYRGYGDDIMRKIGWLTSQKTDYFHSTLIDPTYFEGAAMRTEFGSRVGEKKRRRVNTGIWAGWRKTEYLRKLIPFQEDNFYYLNVNNIITGSVEIRVDGKLVDPREYSIERTKGTLTFKNEGFINPDSRIEIALEYEPEIGGHTNEMIAAENVVVISDELSIGINGLYRGIEEPDRPGTGLDTNRLMVGSINGKIDLKSSSGKVSFKAIPEVSMSYNDSILVKKQGTGTKLTANASIFNLRMKGQAQYYSFKSDTSLKSMISGIESDTSAYETQADISSVYGRLHFQGDFEATYDITPFMPVTGGFSLLGATAGGEQRQYLEYLVSPSGKPSLKLAGMHQSIESKTRGNPYVQLDSIKTERWNWRLESEWDIPQKVLDAIHMNRIWMNASYDLNYMTDSLYDSLGTTDYLEHLNHNIFGWLQFSPLKKLSLETKQIFRLFQQQEEPEDSWQKKGTRYRPEFALFSQDLIPGLTLYGKFNLENSLTISGPDTADTNGEMSKKRLNSSVLVIPGIWWKALNPLQINFGYNFSKEDSTLAFDTIRVDTTIDTVTILDTVYIPTKTKEKQNFGHTFSINPILDFTQDIHIANRSELSIQKSKDYLMSRGIKINNDIELLMNDRKTKFLIEYDFLREAEIERDTNWIDTLRTRKFRHEPRIKWTQRWIPAFRTEVLINANWQKTDIFFLDSIDSPEYSNGISPGILFDWRIQKKFIREFRVQYTIGGSIYEGTFFKFDSYKKSWDNKLDISMKAGRNFFLRMLLNVRYLFDEEMLRYDLAELKATALF